MRLTNHRRLARHRLLPRYLRELSGLLGKQLLSCEATAAIRAQAKHIQRAPSWRRRVAFSERSIWARQLVDILEPANPHPVHVWTPLSNDCGLLRPVALREVQFGFDFAGHREGIVAVVTADLLDGIVLDAERTHDEALLDIEVFGQHWGAIDPAAALP